MTDLTSYLFGGLIAVLAANALYLDETAAITSMSPSDQTIVNRATKTDRLIPVGRSLTTRQPPQTVRNVKDGCDPAISPLAGEVRADIGLRCMASLDPMNLPRAVA